MNEIIKQKLFNYFNNVLKNALGYSETFDINVIKGEITLVSNQDSGLIRFLYSDEKLRKSLKETLLTAFRSQNPDTQSLDIRINGNVIKIFYGKGLNSIVSIKIRMCIASYLTSQELGYLFQINKNFYKICRNQLFWMELFKNKFGDIPEWYPKKYDYKIAYINILKYTEDGVLPGEYVSLRYVIENNRFTLDLDILMLLTMEILDNEESDDFDYEIVLSIIKSHKIPDYLIIKLLEFVKNKLIKK